MKVRVNGEDYPCDGASNVAELINRLKLHPNMALVELNGRALFRHEWEETLLKEGDSLEIIRVVAGG